jgi:hypothetical protein
MKKRHLILAGIVLLLIVAGSGGYAWHSTRTDISKSAIKTEQPKKAPTGKPYTVQLQSSSNYPLGRPTTLRFNIRDQNNNIYKSFDGASNDTLAVTVIRKDRTNYQHLYPTYDQQSGTFTVLNFQFPADGEYRLFAQFVAANAKKDSNDNKIVSAPYIDVEAGDKSKYNPELPIAAKVISNTDGFNTNIFFSTGGDSPGASAMNYFLASDNNTVAIEINKNGAPYKDLQTYKGRAGQITALGPNLELASANSELVDGSGQSGLLIYTLPFPTAGLYKLFMQTQVNNQVSTFDYNVTVKAVPVSKSTKEIK